MSITRTLTDPAAAPSLLIIIRGNSGSGKTTVAKQLRAVIWDGLSDNTMLVQQDVVRRDILRERDTFDKHSIIELTELIIDYGRKQGRIVILEGIFKHEKYGTMLYNLAGSFDHTLAYYFDLPFEETLVRHASKPNANDFGEKEMREWWRENDVSGLPNEQILTADMSADAIVASILEDIKAAKLN